MHAEIAAQGRLTWLRELLRGESNPSATIQCDWILNEGDLQVVLDKSEAKTNDRLATTDCRQCSESSRRRQSSIQPPHDDSDEEAK